MKISTQNGFDILIDDEDYDLIRSFKWWAVKDKNTWYARTNHPDGGKSLDMHHLILPGESDTVVDHINGNGLDNRRTNLRRVTRSINCQKRVVRNELGLKGVHIQGDRYRARITKEGKRFNLGMYETPEEAARAYDDAAIELFGEHAALNYPSTK